MEAEIGEMVFGRDDLGVFFGFGFEGIGVGDEFWYLWNGDMGRICGWVR